MLYDITGVDPRKRKEEKGRLIADEIEAINIPTAVQNFCAKYPNVKQLCITEMR